MSDSLVVIDSLSKIFDPSFPPALHAITATIPKGEIVGLVGPDGAGKTTLIRLIAALLLPTTGKITVAGFDTVTQAEHIHDIMGYMPQKFGLYEDLTVSQNLELYADLRGVFGEERKATFAKLLHFTRLEPFTKRAAKDLSGGMKQKLGLACALIKRPTLLLLDEPSVGVDPLSRRELWEMVQTQRQEGLTILWSTAYLDEAEKCDRVLLLNEGKLLYFGKPQDLGATRFEEAFIALLGGGDQRPSPLAKRERVIEKGEMIVAKELTKRFGNFTAANHISFTVPVGEIFGLLGPNGAGKSTTFRMLCGLLKPTSGQAKVHGLDLQTATSLARSEIGYMAQKFSLHGNLSVLQNLEFFSGIYNLHGKKQKEAIDEMIAIFYLKPYLSTSSDILPLGFKKRLSLACALMHQPKILFLDEPTSGVDPITRREFWNHIHALVQKGVTVLVTTHFMDEAENCNRIALIYKGSIIQLDTPEKLKESVSAPTLEEAFIRHIENSQ